MYSHEEEKLGRRPSIALDFQLAANEFRLFPCRLINQRGTFVTTPFIDSSSFSFLARKRSVSALNKISYNFLSSEKHAGKRSVG